MICSKFNLVALLGVALSVSLLVVGPADARRGGSFGSRGMRTYSAPGSTYTSPGYVPPVQRSMTRPPAAAPYGGNSQPYGARRPGMFSGFGGGMLGGLLAGGLIGGMMGHGFGGGGGWGGGGGGGFLTILIQLAILGGGIWLVMRLFRRPAAAGPSLQSGQGSFLGGAPQPFAAQPFAPQTPASVDILVTQADRTEFERLLMQLQDAFGHEDYGRLREITTPEVMSYLAEELSQNATQGRRNEVTGTRLIQSDVSEAWRENDSEYATMALRYESVDIMRDRTSGAIVQGDPAVATQTTELWTYVRDGAGPWRVSAIQET